MKYKVYKRDGEKYTHRFENIFSWILDPYSMQREIN